jgi:hypothetical protein
LLGRRTMKDIRRDSHLWVESKAQSRV